LTARPAVLSHVAAPVASIIPSFAATLAVSTCRVSSPKCLGIMSAEEKKDETTLAFKDSATESTFSKEDILASENVDPVLNAKMRLVNNVLHAR
jgi:hypothetical protein